MRLVILSDTHNQLYKIDVPEGDYLIHCGDATGNGSIQEIIQFNKELGAIKHRFKQILFVPGNHDRLYEKQAEFAIQLTENAKVLIHEPYELEGLKMFFSPYTKFFCNWAFNLSVDELKEKWTQIPNNTNILVTHGPPHKVMDGVVKFNTKIGEYATEYTGDIALRKRIKTLKELKYHLFGHIHCGYGKHKWNGVNYINASICTEDYLPLNKPYVIDINL